MDKGGGDKESDGRARGRSHVMVMFMNWGRAVFVVLAISMAVAGTAESARAAGSGSLVVCKKHQVSTAAHPCTKATSATTAKSTTTTAVTTTPTTTPVPTGLGPPVPVSDPNPDTGVSNPDVADQGPRVCGCDADTVMHYIDPMTGKYELVIYNTSAIGYINSVNWLPPAGLTVTAITGMTGGSCTLDSGDISCTASGAGLAPPICTCRTGGTMIVDFTATGDAPTFNGSWWTYYGLVGSYMQITSMTPVPYHIPSFITPPKTGV